LGPFRNFNNPGRYNYELAMDVAGLVCAASVSDGRRIVSMGKGDIGFPWETLESMRKPVRDFFEANLSFQNQAILKALILGERQSITGEIREAFRMSGLSHVLAVSGLHIAVVAWLCYTFRKLYRSLLFDPENGYPQALSADDLFASDWVYRVDGFQISAVAR
jgi:competence protein ComEC